MMIVQMKRKLVETSKFSRVKLANKPQSSKTEKADEGDEEDGRER
jgi:hypothetical protein